MPRGSRGNGRRRRPLLAAAAFLLVAGLLSTGSASAHIFTKTDANDSPGKLDIRTASVGHGNNKLIHTVRTFEGWTSKSLGNDSFFIIEIDKNFDDDFEQCAFIFYAGGRLRGSLTNCRRTFIRALSVSKPSKAVASITVPTANTGTAYRWVVFSFWTGLPARCSDLCFDAAPNRPPPILHDLKPPSLSMVTTVLNAAVVSTTTSFSFPFTVSDEHSGIASWTIQQRPVGSTGWTDAVSGIGQGSLEPTIVGTAGSRVDYRVVALDKQGNRTVSATRRVYVPTDAADLGDEAVIAPAPPSEVDDLQAYGGSRTEIDTLTYTWAPGPDCLFEIIASSEGSWQILVSADGNPTVVSADTIPDAERAIVYSDDSCASVYEVFVQNDSGPFPLDAIVGI